MTTRRTAIGVGLLLMMALVGVVHAAPASTWTVLSTTSDCSGAAQQGTAACESYANDKYEHLDYVSPSSAQTADIQFFRTGVDATYFYLEFDYVAAYSAATSTGHNAVLEFEADAATESGRGDYYVGIYEKSEFNTTTWIDAFSQGGYEMYGDPNNDVGGGNPAASDFGGPAGNGYNGNLPGAADTVWARVVGGNFQIAVKRSAVGNPTTAYVRGWTRQSTGLGKDKLYFHDQNSPTDVNQIDNLAGLSPTTWPVISTIPALTISKTDAPDPVAAGANITYTISYSNGGAAATGVVISDTVPANATFVSATGGGTESGGVVTWAIGALAAGASGSVQLVVQVASPLPNGTIITNATYSIDSTETAPTAGAAVTTTVTSAPVLNISKTDAPDPVAAGSNITYTISYSNTGNENATGVVITDTVPTNTTFVSATGGGTESGGVVTWAIGALAAGASSSVTLTVNVNSPLPNGTVITNATYNIDSTQTAPTAGAAVTTTVTSAPVLNISKTDAPDPVAAGSNITYTISYSNTGNANATGVVITDTVPTNTTFVSATGGGTESGGVVTWAIGALAAGASSSVTLTVNVNSPLPNGTIITNSTYSIDSTETAPTAGAAVTTTVTSAPVLSISKTDAPDPVAAGSNITYTISYSNTGNENATGVVITDTVPTNTTFVSATGGGTESGGVVTWAIGALAAGGSGTVDLVVQVASPLPNGTIITNATYSIDSTQTAPTAGAAVTTTVTSAPVLSISKTDAPDPVAAGSNITYTIGYSNTGNENATGVVITDSVPADTTFVSATGGGTESGGVVTWAIGALAAGASSSVTLTVNVNSPLPNGTIITNATYNIDSTQTAPTAGAAVTTTVTSAPVLSISKTDAPDPVAAGSNIVYTISYSNTGNENATGVVITDTVPADTTFVSATGGGTESGGVVTWAIGALAAGASSSVTLTVNVNSPLPNGTVITNATYSIDSTETAPTAGAAVTTTVTSLPVLGISKTDAPDPVAAGSNIVYTISYSNTGNENATGVVITDTVPTNTTFVSATGGGTESGGVVTWAIGPLAAGASASVTLTVNVNSPLPNGTIITNATYNIDSTQTAPTAGAAVTTTVTSAPVLSISKTDAPDPVAAGSNIVYTISYSNTGNENATGVVITDTVPTNTTFVSATGGGTESGGVVTWAIGAVAAGASASVTLTVNVNSPLPNGTIITNSTYSVDSTETAPTAGAAVTTTVNSAPVLGISKTDAPDPVAAGSNITYTISYSNTGNENATGVVITDTVPTNTTFVSATGGGTESGGVVTWAIGAVAAGASASVTLTVNVNSPLPNGTIITNSTYSIDSTETAPTAGAAVTTTVTSLPVLGISKTDAPDPVAAGSNITYTISYSNTGTSTATAVVITDTVPTNTTFVSATGGGTESGGVVTWAIGAVAAGVSASVTLTVNVNSPLPNGTIITNSTYSIDSTETAPTAGAAVTTTVTSAPVLSISKTDAPDPVAAGSNITYTISYSNTGNENATGVVITDTVPTNTTFVSATGGGTESGGVVTWAIGALAAGASSSVTLTVNVNSPLPNGTVITNATYGIDSTQTAPTAGAAVTTTVNSAPVLGISKTDAPDPVAAGSNITYTISYSNTGNENATGVVITDTVPTNTTFVSATGGGTESGGVVTWAIGAVAAGASASVTLTVNVNSPLPNGTIITNATYSIDSTETAPTAGAAVTTTVTSLPVLGISKTDSPDPVAAGSNITYTISYSNTGTSTATAVVITDTVPTNTTFVSATGGGTESGGIVTWAIGAVAAGASASVTLTVNVNSPLPNGTIITNSTYSIDSTETAPTAGAAVTTTVTSAPVLSISKTDAPDPVAAGSNITYTISYSNTGNENATGVVITDTVPTNTTFVSATGGGTESGGVVTWAIGPLAAGASASVTLTVNVNSPLPNGTIITNSTYSVDSTETAPTAGAAVTTTVNSAPVLGISKTDAPDPVAAGSNITYTISYSNTGNENATGVVITDTVPTNTTFVSATGGGTESGGVVTWAIGAVAAGASASVTLTVNVNSPLPNGTIITNSTYSIDSTQTTPTAGAAVTTTVTSAPVLGISKTDAPDPVAAGSDIVYTISYSNTGNENASGVVITDTVPADTTFVSATGGGTESGGVVTWAIGAVAAGASGSVTLTVNVNSPLPNGTIITNATYSIDSTQTAPTAGAAVTTTVTSAPVLGISKTDAPDPVAAGSNITYTISYSNTGNENATGVVITDTVPTNTTFVSATGGGTESGGVVTWAIGAVAAGASASVTLTVNVNSPLPNGTIITNATYSIDSNETAPTAGAAVTTTVTSLPVLGISKTDSPDPVAAGSNITYTISYSNTGTSTATAVVITDTVPANTTFVSATGGGTESGGVVTWAIGALAAGASGSVTLTVNVNSPLPNGTIITNSTYSIDSTETAPTAGAAVTTTVTSAPVLSISKTDAPDPVAAGSNITYTISYSNTGNENATGVVITDTVPTNTTFVSATGGGTETGGVVTWAIGGLAAGASSSVTLTVNVNSPLPNGTIITNSTYSIDSTQTAPTAGAAVTTTVTSAPVLGISKTDAPDPVAAGSNIVYTISYSNTGNENATGVVITDTVPTNTTFVSATGGGTESGGVVTWAIGALAAGASTSVTLTVNVNSPLPNGTIITNATYNIDSTQTAPTAGAAVTTTVTSLPVLNISKTDAPDPVAAGSNITYTISYSNTGNENATGVVITDTVPTNTTFVSATGGGTESGGVVTWTIGALAAGASSSVTLTVNVNSPLPNGTIITNSTYSVDSTETAPTAGAAVTTTVTSTPVLSISKTDAPDPVAAGSNIVYTISYSNTGNENATGVVITDTVPTNTTFVSATGGGTESGGVVTWAIGPLAAGASTSVTLTVNVNSPLPNGTVITNATYSIDSTETAPTAGAAVTTTVTSLPVLGISKTDAPDPVAAGSNITYTISYSNTGTSTATAVVITDTVPTNTTFVSATGGGTESGGVVTWTIGAVAAGASASVTLTVNVNSPLPNGTIITNATYSIDSTQTAPTAGAAVTTTVNSAPVLGISKTDAPDPVAAGSNITYTISYSNTGNENATGVVITDTVPTNTTFVSATGGGTESGGVVTWAIGALAAGASSSVTLTVNVNSPLPNGTIITNATYSIDSNETAPTAGAAVTTTVTSLPILGISKTDAPDPVAAGSNITYTISYSNTGTSTATAVVITDTVPTNTTFVSATGGGTESGGVVTWAIGALAAGASSSVTLTVNVNSPLPNGTIITNATHSIDCNETAAVNGAAVTTTVTSAPVLSVSKTDAPDPVAAGSNITYTISYSNTGNENATGVVITDTVPTNTTFVSATGGGIESGGVVTWAIGGLAAGASSSVTLTVNVNSPLPNGTIITNATYSIDSTQTAPTAGAAVTTTVTSAPVLGISKTDAPDPVAAGSNIVYTISYSNTGNENATGVVITDTVPTNTTFVSATGGGTESGGVVTWAIGALAAGASSSVTLTVNVNSPLPNGTIITNSTYSIDSAQTAPTAGAAVTTTVTSAPVLGISKTDAPDPVAAGSNITYTISYSNTGNENATGVVITDTVPTNTTFVSATGGGTESGGVVTWAIGAVAAGASASVTLTVNVNSPLPNGTIITNATYGIDSTETAPTAGAAVTTTVTSLPVLGISKTDAPDPVAAGSNITYTISYSNTGTSTATAVVITDTVPTNTTFVSATGGGTESGGVVTWAIGALAAGASSSVTLTVNVNSPLPNGTIITNSTYSIDSTETAPTVGAAVTTTVTSAPVLSVSKTDAPDPVAAGSNITYTISYSNTGNENATGVVITDTVPTNTTFVSATGGGTESGGVVTWAIGGLAAGASASVTLTVNVNSPLPNGTVITNATYGIDSTQTAPTSGAAVTTTVTSAPVLSISKTDAPDPVAAGSNITYTISYSNTGNANATGVVITDTVPTNTTFVSATGGGTESGGVVTWAIGALAAGASSSVTLTVNVNSPLPNGTIITNATYSIDSTETAPTAGAAVTTTVTSLPVLGISKTDAPDPVAAGSNITYTISYSNTGTSTATAVVITDTVPTNTTFVSATGGGTESGGVVTWAIGPLAAGASASVTLTVNVNSPLPNGTIITNSTYSIDSTETAPTVGAAVTTTVTSAPVLSVSKTDAPDPVAAGSNITYTISYSNTGNENASGVVISDTVPANTTFVTATGGGTESGGVVTWAIGAVAAGASASVTLTVNVNSPLPNGTIITNATYSIDSTETAPTAGAAVTTTVTSAPVLSISKTDAPDPVAAGSNITYTISYSNTGNANATGVVITDTVPTNTTFVSATGGGTESGGVVTWAVGALAAGGSASVTLTVNVNSPLPNGTIITNATYGIDSTETASTAGAAVTTTVTSLPVLGISKTDAPDPVAAGSNITYTISYSNTGTSTATAVVITDTVPTNTTFVSATGGGTESGGVVTWAIGAVAAGASASVTLTVNVNSPLPNGTIITNATYGIDSTETAPTAGAAVTTTVTSAPVLGISKTDAPDPVAAGSNITYTISYSNTGTSTATAVVITDTVPTNTTFVSATGGGTESGGVVTWAIGALAAGASSSVTLTVNVNSPLPNGTIITNATYNVDSTETAPTAGAAVTTTVTSVPVLSISKTDAPDPVAPGSNITYTISYSNTGNENATGVVITDTVPADTTFVSATGGGTESGGVVTWAIGALAAGASSSVTLTVNVNSPLPDGTIITNATYSIDSTQTAPTAGAAVTTTVNSAPVLSISKTDAPDPVAAGANITYTVSYANTGSENATGVVITDTVPANTTFVSATGGGTESGGFVTWTIGALAAGTSSSVTLTVNVNSPLPNGTIITNSTYSIDSTETAPTAGAAVTTTVTSAPVLGISKTDAPDPVAAGSNITYTISYSNTGNANATGVVIRDTVPANTTFVSATGGGTESGGVVTWAIGALAAGGSASVTLTVNVNSPLPNGTTITNATYDIDSTETGLTAGAAVTTTVTSAPVLTATKTALDNNGGALLQGEVVTYTITVRNTGNEDAAAVALSDAIPADTTLVAGSLTSDDPTDVRTEGDPLTVVIGTLNGVGGADSDVVITFRVRLDTPLFAGTVISNQAAVTAAGGISLVSDDPSTAPPDDPTDLTVVASGPVLVMHETVTDLNGGSLNPGDLLLYTIVITNSGNGDATSVDVADPIPVNTTLVPGSLASDDPTDVLVEGNPVVVNAGTLDAAGTGDSDVIITFQVTVDSGAPSGTVIANQGSVTAAGGIGRMSDDPTANDGLETGNDPADAADDDPTLIGPVSLGDVLQVAKSSDLLAARRGEFILYTITITNPPRPTPVLGVTVSDALPVGLSLVPGTVVLDGALQATPAGGNPTLFPIGDFGSSAVPVTRTLTYRVVVNAGAVIGTLTNRAWAVDAALQPLSPTASNTVMLLEDPEFDLGTIIGKVFDDKDRDGVQGMGEKGIGGAMVAMEDGVYAVTDANGMYHIAAVRPGNRLVKINRHTLPPNDGLTLPEAQAVTLTPGLLVKVNFGVLLKPAQTIRQGRPGTYGVAVAEERLESQTEVAGNLDDMTAVVNGVAARLPKARVKMDVLSLERSLRIVDGRLSKPAVFQIAYPADRSVKEWSLEIFDARMTPVRAFRGIDLKTTRVAWDGRDETGSLVRGGGIYQYQLTIEFTDGSLAKSPLRLFGVNRTSAIAFALTGAAFETNRATLYTSAKPILDEIVTTLRKYPDEKVVVRGHTDNTGDAAWNSRLSLVRATAVREYLVASGIDPERLVVEGRGAVDPIAPNTTAAGRARNRRVEIKAVLQDNELAPVSTAAAGETEREVVVNGQVVPVDDDGSFRAVVDPNKDRGRVYVGLRTEDGGLTATTVTLPAVTILEPAEGAKVEIGTRQDVISLMQPTQDGQGLRYPAVRVPVRGRTEPGNRVFIDGSPVEVDRGGSFQTDLALVVGENVFGIVAVAPNGLTSLVNLTAHLTGVDRNRDLITVRKPVPQFSVELPPRGSVLASPNLFVRGTAPPRAAVTVNRWRVPLDRKGNFACSVRLPEGSSTVDVVVTMPDGSEGRVGAPVEVRSDYFFLVALGDATVNKIKTDGRLPEQYEDDLYVDGRLALYLKGRVRGKYLITGGLDTGDGRLSEIGDRLNDRNNTEFYRHLDPDAFYPVYGDGSRTVKDTNSQGRFYVLVEAPSSTFQWGNYNSGITGNELSSFNRSLYGGKATWKSLTKRKNGEPLGQAVVFAALPETRSAHDEFAGTGGSLYFLRNRGVVPGSEKVRLEARDKITGIPVANVTRSNYVDYEIDHAEGRLLFRTPVPSVAESTTLISDGLLNGNPLFVVVDYEFNDLASAPLDDTTYGARGKRTLGENVAVGATYVKEDRSTGTYTLEGGDVTVRVGKDTQVIAEYSRSENEALPQYVSQDGGLSFTQKNVPTTSEAAQAYKLEIATTQGPARMTGYFRHIDEGFSSSFTSAEKGSDQFGATAGIKLGAQAEVGLLFDRHEVQGISTVQTGTLRYRQGLGKFGLAAEARYRDADNQGAPDISEGIGAIRLDYRPTSKLDFFARFQEDFLQRQDSITAGTGQKRQTTIGADAQVSPKVTVKAELTSGEQGESALVGVTTRASEKTLLYGTYSMSPDRANTVTGTLTIGAATALTDRTKLYTEEQFKTGERGVTTTQTVGLNTRLNERLTTTVAFERARLDANGGPGDSLRQAGSIGASYVHTWFKIFSKFEMRDQEETGVDRGQWLSSNAFEAKVTRDLTLLGRFNYGVTRDRSSDTRETLFREQSVGIAYRPVAFDWINFTTRYTKITDLPPDAQTPVRDRRKDEIFSFQTVVDLNRRLTLTEKFAVRDRTLDPELLAEFESRMSLWINRFSYHLNGTWDAALEYRTLAMTQAADNTSDGFLLEVNRLFLKHLRVGVGYNFTDFTDNEVSANDYSARGFFFRIQGKY